MSAPTGLVLVSHSAPLAAGLAEVAGQMAPDVLIAAAGGTQDGRIGTSFDLVEQAIARLLDGGAEQIVALTDLGSATLTVESVLDVLDDGRVVFADAPFVEGAVAAAVAAQTGGDAAAVSAAAQAAVTAFAVPVRTEAWNESATPRTAARAHTTFEAMDGLVANGTLTEADDAALAPGPPSATVHRTLVLRNRLGLHARPAAMLARKAAEFEASVLLNGVDAASVLALMGLGLAGGAELHLEASGPQAAAAVAAIAADVEAGFGEE